MSANKFVSLQLSFITVLHLSGCLLAHNHFNSTESFEFEAISPPTPLQETSKIIGGVPAQKNEFPWVVYVSIRINNQIKTCGGALIRLDAVLTAAHCVIGASPSDIIVIAGEHILDQAESTEQYGVGKRVKWHEKFNKAFLNPPIHDIAVIKLEQSFKKTPSVQTIRLPGSFRNNFNINQDQITFAGWGKTGSSSLALSNTLRKVTLPVVPSLLCVFRFQWFVRDDRTQFCAGNYRQSVCAGDSGSPAICKSAPGEVCGIASYATDCSAQSFLPGVFNRVAPYLSWINDALND